MSGGTVTDKTNRETNDAWTRTLGRLRPHWSPVLILAVVVAVLIGAGVEYRALHGSPVSDDPNRTVPVSSAMEDKLGVRFSRVAVVADGGLITVSYVVLDSEKASRFQADRAHPPRLSSESRNLSTTRVSLMKQGHVLNAGKTYYLVYENTRGAIRPGERVTVGYGSLRLVHVPVL